MKYDILITVPAGVENDQLLIDKKVAEKAIEQIGCRPDEITALVFRKKSIDARRREIKIHLKYTVYCGEAAPDEAAPHDSFESDFLRRQADPKKRVIIVGAGPAGLFAALRLLENGITPVIIERGKRTGLRKRDIASISTRGVLDADSNYCFGEGGAGTFSDGKLYSRSKKRGDIGKILQIFHHFGADAAILTDAHPHIGSNRLPEIIGTMTDAIRAHGGELHFETRVSDFLYADDRVCGVHVLRLSEDGQPQDVSIRADEDIRADAVLLACGHSADDMYELLATAAPDAFSAKTFAMGVRVEHPRETIDALQFHGAGSGLGAAEYRLSAQIDGRGVYSFCMCPGGFIVPAASRAGTIVVNGMSSAARNSRWSNAAIVVETRPEDIPAEFLTDTPNRASAAFGGLKFRAAIEQRAWQEANKAPAQRLVDFLAGRDSVSLPPSSYAPGVVPSRLDLLLPDFLVARLKKAFVEFDKKMRGFICEDALLVAPETRTSTPVRIERDTDSFECISRTGVSGVVRGLTVCGEVSGYSGGIVSSAIDGENAASAIAKNIYDIRII